MSRKYANLAMRILENIEQRSAPQHVRHLGPCWLWKLSRCNEGYGRLTIRISGKPFGFRVHCVAYELFTGEVLDRNTETLDHLCYRKHCCNPRHLERVSRSENSWRYHRRSEMTQRLLSQTISALRKAADRTIRRGAA